MSVEERDVLFQEMLGSSAWDRVISHAFRLVEAHRRDLLTKRDMENVERRGHLEYIQGIKDLLSKCYGGELPDSISRLFR